MAFVLLISISVSASDNTKKVKLNLNEHQRNILAAFGLNEDQINNVTIKEVRELLEHGTFKDLSKLGIGEIPYYQTFTQEQKDKLKAKGLAEKDIEALHKRGFTPEKMIEMDTEVLLNELNKSNSEFDDYSNYDTITSNNYSILSTTCPVCGSTSHPVPSNMGYVASVPYGGGDDEYFHSDASNPLSIDSAVAGAKDVTERTYGIVYNNNVLSPNIRFSYNLWGEWYECIRSYAYLWWYI